MKTVCSMINLGYWRYEKHEFENTFHQPFLRYGNPDLHFLGTLKIKNQIYRFLSFLSKNMGSDFIFRVAIYLQILKQLIYGTPENKKL